MNVASFKAFQHFTILHARRKVSSTLVFPDGVMVDVRRQWHKGAYVNSLDTGIMLRCAGTSPSTSEVSPLVNDSHRPSRVRLWCCCASPKRRNIISPHAISATSWVTPYITQRKHLELCSRGECPSGTSILSFGLHYSGQRHAHTFALFHLFHVGFTYLARCYSILLCILFSRMPDLYSPRRSFERRCALCVHLFCSILLAGLYRFITITNPPTDLHNLSTTPSPGRRQYPCQVKPTYTPQNSPSSSVLHLQSILSSICTFPESGSLH